MVLTAAAARGRDPVITVLTEDARARRVGPADLTEPLTPIGRLAIPKAFHARVAKDRRDLAATMRARVSPDARPAQDGRAGERVAASPVSYTHLDVYKRQGRGSARRHRALTRGRRGPTPPAPAPHEARPRGPDGPR